MPQKYVADFPTSMAIIDCTELYINKPSSLQVQSQCYNCNMVWHYITEEMYTDALYKCKGH